MKSSPARYCGALTTLAWILIFGGQHLSAQRGLSPDRQECFKICGDWEIVLMGHPLTGYGAPPKPVPPLQGQEKTAAEKRLAQRCLALADKYPDSVGELTALYLAAVRGWELEAGRQARRRLLKRLETVDLAKFERAIVFSRATSGGPTLGARAGQKRFVFPAISTAVLRRVRKTPEHAKAAALLNRVCVWAAAGAETKEPAKHFVTAADLIVARYATSPDIFNFCELLGGIYLGPQWSIRFEPHLRKILKVNKHRTVRFAASLALASALHVDVTRQKESEQLYEKLLKDFDGKHRYQYQSVEKICLERAKGRLLSMKFAPIGRPVPEVLGVDLQGRAMKLSDHRGKVVLVSFWATWCFPCIKLIPHERELTAQHAGKPFVIVGVNGDKDQQVGARAAKVHKISWRSFQDKRPGKKSISDEWHAFYPTVFLIDHKGILRKRWTGAPRPDDLKREVEKLVAAAARKSADRK